MLLSGGVAREETALTRTHSFYKTLLASLEMSDKRQVQTSHGSSATRDSFHGSQLYSASTCSPW